MELDHTAGLKEGRHTVVADIGLGVVVVLHKVGVVEDILAAVDSGYGVGVHMAAAEAEGTLVVGDTDCVKELRMVVVAVVGSPDCTGLGVHTRREGQRRDLPAHNPEVQARHSPAGVGTLVVGNPEVGIDPTEAAGILEEEERHIAVDSHLGVDDRTWQNVTLPRTMRS